MKITEDNMKEYCEKAMVEFRKSITDSLSDMVGKHFCLTTKTGKYKYYGVCIYATGSFERNYLGYIEYKIFIDYKNKKGEICSITHKPTLDGRSLFYADDEETVKLEVECREK